MSQERRDAFAKAQEEQKKSRAAMAEMNARVMDEQAKARPEPSIEEIQKATAPRVPRVVEEPKVEQELVDTASDASKTDKASTADKSPGGNYKTRDMSAKK
jgi:hypothetical protein